MSALPFLPGSTFTDPSRTSFHKTQTLSYKKGYTIPALPTINPLTQDDLDELANFNPSLTYGQAVVSPLEDFVPAAVIFDKKVLLFEAYFTEEVLESGAETFRVRPVKIYYYLEDDSISVVEPVVENSGIPQGTLLKRQRLPVNDVGDYYHWKDLNLGIEVTFYGKTYRIYNCNKFTVDFLESEGIVLNLPEACPTDGYITKRQEVAEIRKYTTPSEFDKLMQFRRLDGKVLKFFCIWDDSESLYGEKRQFILHYYLVDSTLEVREVKYQNDGREPFPIFIGRKKMPLDRKNIPTSFPTIVLETSDTEIEGYFEPKHLKVGEQVYIMDRWFYLYDCDKFTKEYYLKNFAFEFQAVEVPQDAPVTAAKGIPPYDGFGGLEDSRQTCLSLVPKPPKKDYIKMLENNNNILRYQLQLETTRPDDKLRMFILSYRLADDKITIYEKAQRNSGVIGGKYLSSIRVTKPGSTVDNPTFYTPGDLEVGVGIEIFAHRFTVVTADLYVLKYLQSLEPGKIPLQTINSLRIAHQLEPLEDYQEFSE